MLVWYSNDMSTIPSSLHSDNTPNAHPDLLRFRVRLQPEIIPIRPGVWTVFGLSLANAQVIAGPQGLLVVDSGHSAGEGKEILRLIRSVSDAPIRGILYTHFHYVRGSASICESTDTVEIIGHPRLDANYQRRNTITAPAHKQRHRRENGSLLPRSGADAVVAPAPAWTDESAYMPPTRSALPGDHLRVAGVDVFIEEGCFDTNDGLAFRFPQYDVVAHNLVTGQFPNFGSLAGGRYRDPLPWLQAVAALRDHPPEHLLPCHGRPLSGREVVRHRLTLNYDAMHYLYHAVIDGLANGATIPDLLRDIKLPESLANAAELRPLYGNISHAVAAIAYGEMGFWSGETRDLVPLHPDEEAHHLLTLMGDGAELLRQADTAQSAGDLAWAMHLIDAAVRLDIPTARQRRASLLRKLASQTRAWTERNTLLSLALEDDAHLQPL